MKKLIFLSVFILLSNTEYGQENDYQTLKYYENDTLSLDLDLFLPENPSGEIFPLMIFVHGGGFRNGVRENGHDICRYLSQNGYAAATMSYSLYMTDKSFSCDGELTEKIKAIQIAVNQLWLATGFMIKNAGQYHLDTSNIFISGSSAGAETVLHAAFWDRQLMDLYGEVLPDSFHYAGLVSGAGAIMDINLLTKENVIPVMLFHGNGDRLVPYGTAAHHYCPTNSPGWLMLFGAWPIYNRVCELGAYAELFTYCGGGHEHAGTLFHNDLNYIYEFMNDVLNERKIQKHIIIPTGKSNELSREYSFCN